MAEEKKAILTIDLNLDSLITKIDAGKKKVAELQAKSVELATKSAEALKAGAVAEYEELNRAIIENDQSIRLAKESVRSIQKEYDLTSKAINANTQSYEQLLRNQQLAQTRLKLMEGTLQRNADGTFILTDAYKKQALEVKQAKDALIAFDQGISDGRTNVGNYAASIQDVIEKTGLMEGVFGKARVVVEGFKSVLSTGSDITKGLTDQIGGAIDKTSQWMSVTMNAGSTFSSTSSSAGTMAESYGKAATAAEDVAVASEKAGTAGAGVWTKIRTAMIASGVGAIVLAIVAAIATLVAYFTKTEAGAEKLERGLAGVSAALDVILGAAAKVGEVLVGLVTNFDETIKKLSFANVVKGFKDTATEASKAATAAADLKGREQDLEDARRESLVTQAKLRAEADKLRKIEDDKTKTGAERLAAAKRASEIEQQIQKQNIDFAREEANVLDAQNEIKRKAGTLRDEDLKKEREARAELVRMDAEYNQKSLADAAETSKLRNKIQQDEIRANAGLLSNELKRAEINGLQTLELKKEIARKERDAAMADTTLSALEKEKIEDDYRTKLLEITKQTEDERQKLLQQSQDIAISLIIDGRTKEVAAEVESARRKLEAIKGNSAEEVALREQIALASGEKILEINRKYDDLDAKQRAEVAKSNSAILLAQINQTYAEREGALKVALTREQITQQDYDRQVSALNLSKSQEELNVLLQLQGARQASDEQYYQTSLQRLRQSLQEKKITQEQYNADVAQAALDNATRQGQTEVETQATINQQLAQIQQQRVDAQVATDAALLDSTRQRIEAENKLQVLSLELAGTVISGMGDLLGQDEQNRKKFGGILKTLALAEVAINLQKELSAIALYAQENPANALTGGGAGAAIIGVQYALAIARATLASAKIAATKYEDGGYTVDGQNHASLSSVVSKYQPTNVGSFQSGGVYSRPSLGLVGEAGTELVVNNRTLRSDPHFFSMVEKWNRTGVKPFAVGGFTSGSVVSSSIMNMEPLKDILVEALATLPNPVVDVRDIITSQKRVTSISESATI